MARLLVALGTGILFGLGLAVSHMVNPAKVLGFLDVTGNWDPSLILVMAGALAVTTLAFPRILRQSRPAFDRAFVVAAKGQIDMRLIGGSVIFGIGWGLVGFCPGPAVAALAYGHLESVIFLAAMLAGMWLYRVLPRVSGLPAAG
jgi:hypothetical protein